MKRFLILLSLLFCNVVFADTINLHWLNEDGTTYQNSTCVIDSDLILPATPPTKYGYTFTGWKIGNYIPIEYIESTGTQYIYAGIKGDARWVLDAQASRVAGSSQALVSSTVSPTPSGSWYGEFVNTGYWNVYSSPNTNILPTTRTIADLTFDNNGVRGTIDNISVSRIVRITQGDWYLFITIDNEYPFFGKLFSAKCYQNNILVRDFIPVLDKNGVPCLFDRVEAKFYYNQGTGQFIAGPVLQ
jgi:hypothetical protein